MTVVRTRLALKCEIRTLVKSPGNYGSFASRRVRREILRLAVFL
jgi:hypothetical protein